MQRVLKFPFDRVKRSTDKTKRSGQKAEILFFTGVRYARLSEHPSISVDREPNRPPLTKSREA